MRIQAAMARRKHWIFSLTAALVCSSASLLISAEGKRFESREAEIADAVQRNGDIFEDWPKPQLAIVFSGEMDGYLEPCGCAGLENQLGGLKRRHTLLRQLEAQGWPLVSLDMGGMVRRAGPQAEMKYRYALKSLVDIGYGAVGFGVRELQLSSDAVIYALANLDPNRNPMVSANVGVAGFDSGFSKKYKIIEAGGKRLGVTSVLGKSHESDLQNATDVAWIAPDRALREIVPLLESKNCDLLILLAHADQSEARRLAQNFPQFHFVATSGAPHPPDRLESIEHTETQLIEAGHKGMHLMVLGVYDDLEEPYRIQRVPLDHRFEDSTDMQQMLVAYQEELKGTGFDGLGITGVKNPTDGFVGTESCADCHTQAAEEFEKTPHSHATQSLVSLDPPRQFDPECLSCHVTGWQPEKYFPYASGFASLDATPHLTDNGCENCHGPGQAHVAAESGDVDADDAELERLRARMRLTIVENEGNKDGQVFKDAVVVQMCIKCHDEDNSPDFDF
ncbi:MAG: hypothetical protein MI725_03555, partial [Pirellulales bacterium]|nr:hypothetical protein [Pirellulales bacterium]